MAGWHRSAADETKANTRAGGPAASAAAPANRGRPAFLLRFAPLGALLAIFTATILGSTGCMVRSDTPVMGPDSTLVFPSRLSSDVNARITFALRDSRNREAEREADRDRQREITRLQKNRDKLVEMRSEQQERDRAAAQRAALKAQKEKEKKEKAAREKASKKKSGKKDAEKKKSTKKESVKKELAKDEPAKKASGTSGGAEKARRTSRRPVLSLAAIDDSLAVIDLRLAQLVREDSLAQASGWRQRKAAGLPEDERVFDLEEDARILATVWLDNVYARGTRPMTVHLIWVNPDQKKVFKRMIEYTPNDSTQKITSSFTIPPSRRSPGFYKLRVYLHRELIAEKALELRGTGLEVPEESSGDGAM